MIRRLFTISSIISLALCVGLMPLWMRSYWRLDKLGREEDDGTRYMIASNFGAMTFGWLTVTGYSERNPHWESASRPAFAGPLGLPHWSLLGFSSSTIITPLRHGRISYTVTERYFAVPYWFLVLIMAILPAFWVRKLRQRRLRGRRIALGLCVECGYDLRASHDKCPECGATIPPEFVRKPLT